jgi:hypothetical protein
MSPQSSLPYITSINNMSLSYPRRAAKLQRKICTPYCPQFPLGYDRANKLRHSIISPVLETDKSHNISNRRGNTPDVLRNIGANSCMGPQQFKPSYPTESPIQRTQFIFLFFFHSGKCMCHLLLTNIKNLISPPQYIYDFRTYPRISSDYFSKIQ